MSTASQISPQTAAFLVIGNEILSGRTQDTNTHHLAGRLTEFGIRLIEVRVVPDRREAIIAAVNTLRSQADMVLTSGGIGPTHDDITAEAVAAAFGVPVVLNMDARAMLLRHYGDENALNDARLKMAHVPDGSTLINNPVSGAPGFKIGNVYVMAGVPRIMQAMVDEILLSLTPGPRIASNTVACDLPESKVADELENIQTEFPDVEIGSYPHYRGGVPALNLVLRGTDMPRLNAATVQVAAMVRALGGTTDDPVLQPV